MPSPPKQTLPTLPLVLSRQELQGVTQLFYDILADFILFSENRGSAYVRDCFLFQAISSSRLSAHACGAGEEAAMEQSKSAGSTPLHLLTFLAGPRYKLERWHSCSILIFAAAKNTQGTAPFQPERDCHQIPTRRLLEV